LSFGSPMVVYPPEPRLHSPFYTFTVPHEKILSGKRSDRHTVFVSSGGRRYPPRPEGLFQNSVHFAFSFGGDTREHMNHSVVPNLQEDSDLLLRRTGDQKCPRTSVWTCANAAVARAMGVNRTVIAM
jgi:hypothetical protein